MNLPRHLIRHSLLTANRGFHDLRLRGTLPQRAFVDLGTLGGTSSEVAECPASSSATSVRAKLASTALVKSNSMSGTTDRRTRQYRLRHAMMALWLFVFGWMGEASRVHAFTLSQVVPPAEYQALVDFYNSTGGPNWIYGNNWFVAYQIPSWSGLTFSGLITGPDDSVIQQGHVATLEPYGRLRGSIPASIGNLSALRTLNLTRVYVDGHLSGSIPDSLGNLSALQNLWLDGNYLSGNIPVSLGSLTALQYLGLSDNQLSGSIPSELGNLSALKGLWLRENQLSGSIPFSLGNLTALQNLYLNDNELSGSIPASLGNLIALQNPESITLDLSQNQLSGRIPLSVLQFLPVLTQNFITLDSQQRAEFASIPSSHWESQKVPSVLLEPSTAAREMSSDPLRWETTEFFGFSSTFLDVTNMQTGVGPLIVTLESQTTWLKVEEFAVGAPPSGATATATLGMPGTFNDDTSFHISADVSSMGHGRYTGAIKAYYGGGVTTIPVTYTYGTNFQGRVIHAVTGQPLQGATVRVVAPSGAVQTAVTGADGYAAIFVYEQGTYQYTATALNFVASATITGSVGPSAAIWPQIPLTPTAPDIVVDGLNEGVSGCFRWSLPARQRVKS
jgi:hypothetical protein